MSNAKKKDTSRDITEDFVQTRVIEWLSKHHWRLVKVATLREKGVDIKAVHTRYSRYYLIECKGSNNSSSEEVAFIYSLGQIITRMNTSGSTRYYYGIALPKKSADKAIKRIPYQIAKKLLLHVFSVDKQGNVVRYMPADLEKIQK
ncbi:MAG: hypothetical protein H6779_02505 [Candidatus Nomurabacteria bacterium]|nr:hypothetical protein [Candidatus Nomurabacteria bacterium]USN87260.1 MAG: hypothetical protein H6779_02505 [Candidatus Nomurabacteria bacterium]